MFDEALIPTRGGNRIFSQLRARRYATAAALVAVWLLLLGAIGWQYRDQIVRGGNDFLALYAAGRAAGSADLYDAAAIRRLESEAAGMGGQAFLVIRPPFVAEFAWPIAHLPYRAAYLLWILLNAAAIAGFVWCWDPSRRFRTFAACCLSAPLASSFANGQDIPILLLWVALLRRYQLREQPRAAGSMLSLCAAKFHLFLLFPLVLAAQRRWKTFAAAAAGVGVLLLASFAAYPGFWPAAYLEALQDPSLHPGRQVMPSLYGALYWLPAGWAWTLGVSVAIAAVAWIAVRRADFDLALAAALTGGLLVSWHSYIADGAMLVPASLILYDRGGPAARGIALAVLSPLPWAALINAGPLPYAGRALLLAAFGAVCYIARKQAPAGGGDLNDAGAARSRA